MGQEYRSLLERWNALSAACARLKIVDEYFKQTIKLKIDIVEMITDTTERLSMRYKTNKQNAFDLQFHDDEEVTDRKHKVPSWGCAYELANVSGPSSI